MALERTGIVEEMQRGRRYVAPYEYRAPSGPAPTHSIVVDCRTGRRTITRLHVDLGKPPTKHAARRRLDTPPNAARFREAPERKVSAIVTACAVAFNVGPGEILSEAKPNRLVYPRFALIRLLRVVLKFSHPQIAKIIRRDHTSALAGFRRGADMRTNDPKFRHCYRSALLALRQKTTSTK